MVCLKFVLFCLTLFILSLENISTNAVSFNCKFPPIDFPAQTIDVLGDLEKSKVCSLPAPTKLCYRVGLADKMCKKIAKSVGCTSNATCSHPNTCSFLVKRPVQHPSTPGYAHVSLCTPDFAGVIFPCRENNLVIINPFYKQEDFDGDADEAGADKEGDSTC